MKLELHTVYGKKQNIVNTSKYDYKLKLCQCNIAMSGGDSKHN